MCKLPNKKVQTVVEAYSYDTNREGCGTRLSREDGIRLEVRRMYRVSYE